MAADGVKRETVKVFVLDKEFKVKRHACSTAFAIDCACYALT
jgi:hypothetical protein